MLRAKNLKETSEKKESFISKIRKINPKVWAIVGGVVAVVVIIIIAILLIGNSSNESKLEKKLEDLAVDFYENFYYDSYSSDEKENAEFVKKYEETGIKIDLSNLARYAGSKKDAEQTSDEILKEFTNSKTKKACDTSNTKAIICPKSEYGKKDYTIKVALSCGFSDEETDLTCN